MIIFFQKKIDETIPQHDSTELNVSPSLVAKFLEDELKASNETKHCDTCNCCNKDLSLLDNAPRTFSIATQTLLHGNANNALCLRCNSNLNSPSRTNSPYIMKLVKSSDSVISETKSSVSTSTQNDKIYTPAKKDDLMVNPILGHHRLCDRTQKFENTAIKINCEKSDLELNQKKIGVLIKTPDSRKSETIVKMENDLITSHKESLSDAGNGSTNSLWSKTSSAAAPDGAKMFENFNLNLIKTIKVS